MNQIINNLIISPIVVADLTDLNSNVFWELGVRQSFMHNTITIAQNGTKIPFDIFSKAILFYYPENHVMNAKFCTNFRKALFNCLQTNNIDSRVLETLSGRGTLFEIVHQNEILRRIESLEEEHAFNINLHSKILSIIEENKAEPENRKNTSTRFSSACIELLITHRYLDEEQSFYAIVGSYFVTVNSMNENLRTWQHNPQPMEEIFIHQREFIMERFEQYLEALTKIKEKMSKRYPTVL